MTLSITLALIWLVVVNLRGMFPSKDNHWRFAYFMIALGVPLIGVIWYQHGFWLALVFLLMAMWVMRWPVIYLGRWMRRKIGYTPE
ncbi:DUF2484 family protein [Shimia thalassica]|uniref:DUF2484 family protein n=1 Tax=Shimia thalassica TaxID=1715693 RepID=UPI0026E3B3DC|nr:DUF2484 family protein [Shimia thalassica]MDO6479540.1 DUF2484 family protein [Shimia thalassica]